MNEIYIVILYAQYIYLLYGGTYIIHFHII